MERRFVFSIRIRHFGGCVFIFPEGKGNFLQRKEIEVPVMLFRSRKGKDSCFAAEIRPGRMRIPYGTVFSGISRRRKEGADADTGKQRHGW